MDAPYRDNQPMYDTFKSLGLDDIAATVTAEYEQDPHKSQELIQYLLSDETQRELSEDALRRIALFASGRPKSRMTFIPHMLPSVQYLNINKLRLQELAPTSVLISEEYLNKVISINDPRGIYLPVIRYQTGMSLYYKHLKAPTAEEVCGTFYYFEPQSYYFLNVKNILVAPNKVVATYYLLKIDPGYLLTKESLEREVGHRPGSSIRKRIEMADSFVLYTLSNIFPEIFPPDEFFLDLELDEPHRSLTTDDFAFATGEPVSELAAARYNLFILYRIADSMIVEGFSEGLPEHSLYLDEGLKEIFEEGLSREQRTALERDVDGPTVFLIMMWIMNLYEGRARTQHHESLWAKEDDLDLPICWESRDRGYDAVVLTTMVGTSRLVTEVYDVRDRQTSFSHIVKVAPH